MKYESLSRSAIPRNVSVTITANWANLVCHLEISKPPAIKDLFFHEPQIKSSLETWISLSYFCFILLRGTTEDYQMNKTKTWIRINLCNVYQHPALRAQSPSSWHVWLTEAHRLSSGRTYNMNLSVLSPTPFDICPSNQLPSYFDYRVF